MPLIGVFAFLLVLSATLMLSAEDVSADTILVPDRYPTIQQAVDNATVGDEIRIRAGLYNESVKVTKPVTLRRYGEGETIITSDEEYVLRLEGKRITAQFLTIVGSSDNYGIHCYLFSDGLLGNVQVRNCSIGMLLTATYDSMIKDATFEDCTVGIVAANGTYNNHFEKLTLQNNMLGLDVGSTAYPIDDSDNYFTGCVFESNEYGARIGINGPRSTFDNCGFAYNNGGTALNILGADCLVDRCVIQGNDLTGISLKQPGTVTNSTVINQGYRGIEIIGTGGCTITNVTLEGNEVGVYLQNVQQTTLSKLYGSDNFDGIWISSGSIGVTLSDSEFFNNSGIGMTIEDQSDDVTVRSCNFASNFEGILISQSTNVVVSECTFTSNRRSGVHGVDSNQLLINGSSIILTKDGHGLEFSGCRAANIVHCTLTNNHRSGISFTSWDYQGPSEKGVSDCRISGSGESGISLDKVTGITIAGNTIENNDGGGIVASATLRSTVTDNRINGNAFGIALNESQGCLLSKNSVRLNDQEGIRLISSGSGKGNEILDNSIVENSLRSAINHSGILLSGQYTKNNIVARNSILSNPVGIRFESYTDGCDNNLVYQNMIRNCMRYGIGAKWNAGPNSIHLNTFISNEEHVNGVHDLDSFYASGLGNYWDDYRERYPDAVRNGAIWNTPYEVESGTNMYDKYPLAFIYETDPPDVYLKMDDTVAFGDHILLDATGTWDQSMFASFTWTILSGSSKMIDTTNTNYLYFTPTSLGEHRVLLVVEDSWGNSAEALGEFTVIDNIAPIVYAGDDHEVDVGLAFDLNVIILEENHAIRSIDWVVDPGGLNIHLQGSWVTLTIDRVGTFTVNLTVTDMSGNVGTDSLIIYVLDPIPPIAIAGSDVVVGIQQRVAFDGSQSSDNIGIVKFTWSFIYNGTEHDLEGARVGFDFSIPGRYTVWLKVEDASGNEAKDSLHLNARDTEPPVAHAGDDVIVDQGDSVTLSSSGSSDNIGIKSYRWMFYQEGAMSRSSSIVTIPFSTVGEYPVVLYVYDAQGNWASDRVTVTVRDTQSPQAVASLPSTLPIGTTIQLDGSYSSDNVEVVDYHWTVKFAGKQKTLNGPLAEFSFTSSGHYVITLTVRDASGNEDSDTNRIVVTVAESDTPETAAWVIPMMAFVLIAVLIAGLVIGPKVLKGKE